MTSRPMIEDRLCAANLSACDPTGQLGVVCAMPEHLRDALMRARHAGLHAPRTARGLVVAGMGGSAIGASLAQAILGDRLAAPVTSARGYELPPFVDHGTTVLCASYSGNTEETLACYEDAGVRGAARLVCTSGGQLAERAERDGVPMIDLPGGYQPRAAVAYAVVSALAAAAACAAAADVRDEVARAAEHLRELVAAWGPGASGDSVAKALARRLHATVPLIYGAGPTGAIAYRWKCQLNENAKLPAFAHELPELDHNEIVGWDRAAGLAPFSAVFLSDDQDHPRARTRIELTEKLIAPEAARTAIVTSVGTTRAARMLSLVLLGDLVSIYLAALDDIDPAPVSVIERLKDQLAVTPA